MANTTSYFQKSDNDCWICALRNMLGFLGIFVSEDQIRDILLCKKGLVLLSERGFFPYLPEVFDALSIPCDFVLDSDNFLLTHIFSEKKISMEKLETVKQEAYDNRNALYYFYKSLKSVCGSPYVTIKFDESIREYLDRDYVVAACLTVSELYGIKRNYVLHMVTMIKEEGKIKVMDPYEHMGRAKEKNWNKLLEFRDKKDWEEKVPYFIAAKINR